MGLSQDTFERILSIHEPRLRALVRTRLRQDFSLDADDILQEVRIRLWRAFERENSIEHLASYIQRTVLSVVIDAVRRRNTRNEESLDQNQTEHEEMPMHLPESTLASPDQSLARSQQLSQLSAAMAQLPERRREPTKLLIQGFSPQEMAHMLDLSEATARNLAYRGLEELKMIIAKMNAEYGHD